ncbi:hypothetical protein [Piscinibacter sakaiensis]|uniref:hypothetical protein n=1 Tax=Piscinibacter sakaiensis TaxID=1547922 RepID=UPI003AAEABDD
MTTITYNRRDRTGRPLGFVDVINKIIETAVARLGVRSGEPDIAAREAAAVRRMARFYQRQAPGFAADLYAAADRHDRDSAR